MATRSAEAFGIGLTTDTPKPIPAVRLLQKLGARDVFDILNPHVQASRPVVGQRRGAYKLDKTGRKRYFGKPTPILGAPTFRNVTARDGKVLGTRTDPALVI